MERVPYAWIANETMATTIEASNATQRKYLREQLIPFIREIHTRNLNNPDNLIPLGEFMGGHVGRQLSYKVEKYITDLAYPEVRFAPPNLSVRPNFTNHVDPQFIDKLTLEERMCVQEAFNKVYDKQQGEKLYPHNSQELGIWQVQDQVGSVHNSGGRLLVTNSSIPTGTQPGQSEI